jgi:hypothetical protein
MKLGLTHTQTQDKSVEAHRNLCHDWKRTAE